MQQQIQGIMFFYGTVTNALQIAESMSRSASWEEDVLVIYVTTLSVT
jgi:hypothetical protein